MPESNRLSVRCPLVLPLDYRPSDPQVCASWRGVGGVAGSIVVSPVLLRQVAVLIDDPSLQQELPAGFRVFGDHRQPAVQFLGVQLLGHGVRRGLLCELRDGRRDGVDQRGHAGVEQGKV